MPTITASSILYKRNLKEMILWETVTCGDVGTAYEIPDWAVSITIQVCGTFTDASSPAATATLTLQGSNDGTNWATVPCNYLGNVAFTADGILSLAILPKYVRPSMSLASGGDVDVYLFARKT